MAVEDHQAKEQASPLEPDDTQLVLAAQAGDREAFAQLVRRHHSELCRLLWRFVRNSHDLDDLVQDVFLKAYTHLPDWEPRQPFLHWLKRVAANAGRDHCRRESSRRKWQEEEAGAELGPGRLLLVPDRCPDPAARAAANELKDFLGRLPPDDQALLILHHLEGWELKEIAANYGWTLAGVKLRAFRARHRLKKLLNENDAP